MSYAASYQSPSYQSAYPHSSYQQSPSYHHSSYHHSPSYHHSQPSYYASHPYQSYGHYEPSHNYHSYHTPHYGHHDYGHHHGYGHQQSYGHHGYDHHHSPSYNQESHHGSGLVSAASLLIPLLGLIGLSLLVPNVVGLRAKREIQDPDDQRAQKLMDVYTAVLSSEDCIQKLFCEMGHLAKNSKDQQGLFKLMERVVPPQFQGEFNILKESTRSPVSICSKYMCNIAMPQQSSSSSASSQQQPMPSATNAT